MSVPSNAKIFAWGTRALYLGPAFSTGAHRVGVAAFCCGISGAMRVALDPRDSQAESYSCRTALISAGELHKVEFDGPIACLYLDPQASDVSSVAALMNRHVGHLITDHARQDEIVDLLADAARGKLDHKAMAQQLLALLELAASTRSDERVARAIACMRSKPGGKHSLTSLARAAGLSESRLQHLFKTCTGVSVRRFRTWNRMGAAIGAAAKGASLTDAAHFAGFSSSAHFSSAFRAMFGLSPSDLVRNGLEVIVSRNLCDGGL
jgi:AraC-like DNA-binding protein